MYLELVMLLICIVASIKAYVTHKQFTKILEAIGAYNIACIRAGNYEGMLEYNCIGKSKKIFFNPFDWGHNNILSPDEYSLVEPYIDKKANL